MQLEVIEYIIVKYVYRMCKTLPRAWAAAPPDGALARSRTHEK
mgnify:CR=1 FL=1